MTQEAVCEVCGDWAREFMSSDPHHPTCPVGKAVAAMNERCAHVADEGHRLAPVVRQEWLDRGCCLDTAKNVSLEVKAAIAAAIRDLVRRPPEASRRGEP